MTSNREQLLLIRSQALARIAEITAEPKPSYSIDGQQVSWSHYLAQLQQTVQWCNQQLSGEDPFEEHTQAIP